MQSRRFGGVVCEIDTIRNGLFTCIQRETLSDQDVMRIFK